MSEVITLLGDDFRTLRAGRASSDLVGTLPAAAYGSSMPINQLASISATDQGQLLIAPFDKANMASVEKAIRDSQLGFSVVNEGEQLRLSVPPMSEERRNEFVKLVHQKGEAARIRLRQIRTDALQAAERDKKAGTMREDELKRFEKDLNEFINDFNLTIKQLVEKKEQELLTQ